MAISLGQQEHPHVCTLSPLFLLLLPGGRAHGQGPSGVCVGPALPCRSVSGLLGAGQGSGERVHGIHSGVAGSLPWLRQLGWALPGTQAGAEPA